MRERPKPRLENHREIPRRGSSNRSAETVEQPMSREASHELARELAQAEHEMQNEVHDAMAGFLTRLGRKAPARWVARGALLATLFSAETAMANASALSHTQEERPNEEWDEQRILQEKREALLKTPFAPIVEAGGKVSIGVGKGMGFSYGKRWERELADSGRVRFEGHHLSLRLSGLLSEEQASDLFGDERLAHLKKGESDTGQAFQFRDTYDNQVTAIFGGRQDGRLSFNVSVKTPEHFAVQGEENSALAPVSIDLESVGLGKYENIFFVEQVPFVRTIGTSDAYCDGMERDLAEQLLTQHEMAIRFGIERAAGLFGGKGRPGRIVLRELIGQNAGVDEQGTLILHQQLLDPVRKLQQPLTSKSIDTILSHEVFHIVDQELAVSDDPRWLSLFDRMTSEDLKKFNEDHFREGFGGHAEDNAKEFFASFVNSLDVPTWQTDMYRTDQHFRSSYRDALHTLSSILGEQKTYSKDWEIFSLIEKRLAALDRMDSKDHVRTPPPEMKPTLKKNLHHKPRSTAPRR